VRRKIGAHQADCAAHGSGQLETEHHSTHTCWLTPQMPDLEKQRLPKTAVLLTYSAVFFDIGLSNLCLLFTLAPFAACGTICSVLNELTCSQRV
jgi:hypothetical protein